MNMQHYSDEEILNLYRDESSRNMALHYLIQKYQQKLYWHIRKIVISHDDTEDLDHYQNYVRLCSFLVFDYRFTEKFNCLLNVLLFF